jgi:hypothetical protein
MNLLTKNKHKTILIFSGILLTGALSVGYVGWNTFINDARKHVKHLKRHPLKLLFKKRALCALLPFFFHGHI